MKFLQNSSCGACRVAKVKCVHDPPGSAGEAAGRCVRCSRLDLDCVVEARRSKWDNKARPTPLAGLPAELASNPEYSRLIAELDKLRPIVEYEMKLHMYEKQVAPRIAHLLHLSLANDDAAAFACAAAHIQKFGLKPSSFRPVLEGRPPPNLIRPEAASSSSSSSPANEKPFTFTHGVSAALAHRAPPQLPPHMAELFEGEAQAIAVVLQNGERSSFVPSTVVPALSAPFHSQHAPRPSFSSPHMAELFEGEAQAIAVVLQNGERSFHVNQHCRVDPERLRTAVGPYETTAVIGLSHGDAQRFFQRISDSLKKLQEKATTDLRPSGHIAELPPILVRFPDRLDPSQPPVTEPKLLLHVLRGFMHVASDGETMCAVQRYLPLARSSGRKRKAAPGSLAQEGARWGAPAAWGGEEAGGEANSDPDGSASPDGDACTQSGYDLRTLLEEVGGNDALLRELIDATKDA